MSDTPRTDNCTWRENRTEVVLADHARGLERELGQSKLECFHLAAQQCAEFYGDEGGTPRCKKDDRIRELEKSLSDEVSNSKLNNDAFERARLELIGERDEFFKVATEQRDYAENSRRIFMGLAAKLDMLDGATTADNEIIADCQQIAAQAALSEPHSQYTSDMVLVPREAVALAWSIAKELRDDLLDSGSKADQAEKDLQRLKAAGFAAHLPTLDDVRGILTERHDPFPSEVKP